MTIPLFQRLVTCSAYRSRKSTVRMVCSSARSTSKSLAMRNRASVPSLRKASPWLLLVHVLTSEQGSYKNARQLLPWLLFIAFWMYSITFGREFWVFRVKSCELRKLVTQVSIPRFLAVKFDSSQSIIMGNAARYEATSGKAFIWVIAADSERWVKSSCFCYRVEYLSCFRSHF